MIRRQVMSRKAVIKDAKSFMETFQTLSSNIIVTEMPEDVINRICDTLELDKLWSAVPPIAGTINVHNIATENGELRSRLYSIRNGLIL